MGCCRWCVWTLVVVAAGLAFLVYLYDLSSPETPTMSTTPSSAPEPLKPWESNYLLPDSIRPLTYDILLHPELASGQFTGRVRITINISQAMGYCLLNADGLTIDDTRLRMADGVPIRLNKTFNYRPSQYWVIVPQDTLLPGSYQVEVDFRGSLIGKIEGFYLSSYHPNSNSSVTS